MYNLPKMLEINGDGKLNVALSDDPMYAKVIFSLLLSFNRFPQIYKQYMDFFFTALLPLLGLIIFNTRVYCAMKRHRRFNFKSSLIRFVLVAKYPVMARFSHSVSLNETDFLPLGSASFVS